MQAMAEMDRTPRTDWLPSQFVLVPENRSAVLAVRRLARRLERPPFVPLVLHGPPGTGKSHLADDLLTWAAPRGDVFRQEAGDWSVGDASEARRCDLLIVEDLQHLHDRAMDEFAAVLDRRISRRSATLITATHGPAELANLPARLVSRLTGGLVVGMEALGVASRRKFLRQRAKPHLVPPEILAWLARHTPGSGRQLLSVLEQLRRLPPDLAAVRAHFREAAEMSQPTLERITERVGEHYGVAPRLIRGRDRQPGVLWPRQVSIYLARELTGLSLTQIGEYFGRDHSTVRHACQKVEGAIAENIDLAGRVRELRTALAQ